MIIFFLIYDTFRLFKNIKVRTFAVLFSRIGRFWPILPLAVLLIWFISAQSSSNWNNVYFCTATWFPGNEKSMSSAGLIQAFNWRYIELKYGSFLEHDFYFTNTEAFGGASSLWGMLFANPYWVIKIIAYNFVRLTPSIIGLGYIPHIKFVSYLVQVFLLLGTAIGVLRLVSDMPMKIFLLSSFAQVAVMVISVPRGRYIFPMIPIFVMAASWYGNLLSSYFYRMYNRILFLPKFESLKIKIHKTQKIFTAIPTFAFIIILSGNNLSGWANIMQNIDNNLKQHHFLCWRVSHIP